MHPTQILLRLIHTVTSERSISLVCIPDRDSAECELTKLRYEHGPRLLKAIIRKDRPSRRLTQHSTINHQPRSTYTLRYTVRETHTETLF